MHVFHTALWNQLGVSRLCSPAYTVKNAYRFPGFPWNLSFLILQNTHLLRAENFAHSPSWILSFSRSKKCSLTRRGTKFRAEEWNPPPPECNPGIYPGNLAVARKKPGNFSRRFTDNKVFHICWFRNNTGIPVMAGLFELDYIFLGTKQNVKKAFENYTDQKLCQRALQLAFLHCKKRLAVFPSPAGMSLTKLSLGGNN